MPTKMSEELTIAQNAIHLPEVQDMLRKLSEYHLGVYMPHMHDEKGAFLPLPAGMTQVEDDFRVSFQPLDNPAVDLSDRCYVPVAWVWSDGPTPGATCKSRCNKAHHSSDN